MVHQVLAIATLAKASLVGAKRVKGPSLAATSDRLAAVKAAHKVENLGVWIFEIFFLTVSNRSSVERRSAIVFVVGSG